MGWAERENRKAMRLEVGVTQRFDGGRVIVFPYSMSYVAKEAGDYLLGWRKGVARYSTPGFALTLALLSREQVKVPVGGEE